MMEESDAREGHSHVVLIASHNDMIISDGAAGLCNILNAALIGSFDIVTEWEECIGTERNVSILGKPLFLLGICENFRLLLEQSLPCAIS